MAGARGPARWHGMLVLAAALTALAWSGYHGFQRLSAHWSEAGVETGGAQPAAPRQPRRSYDLARIIEAHIFGQPGQTAAPQPQPAPETKLRIDLLGVVSSADSRLSRAIIDVDGARVRPYSVGQTIEGTDASLHAVETNRVLLERGGALESLKLKRAEAAGPVTASAARALPEPSTRDDGGRGVLEQGFRRQLEDQQMKQPF